MNEQGNVQMVDGSRRYGSTPLSKARNQPTPSLEMRIIYWLPRRQRAQSQKKLTIVWIDSQFSSASN